MNLKIIKTKQKERSLLLCRIEDYENYYREDYRGAWRSCGYEVYDSMGRTIVPLFEKITEIESNNEESFFQVMKGGTYGIYNMSGKVLIPCEYSDISIIDDTGGEKLFKVKKGSYSCEFGLYNMSGKVVIPCKYSDISIIDGTEGEKLFKIKKGYYPYEYGICDYVGNEILAPDFQDCDYLGNNLFSFKMNGYWGVLDKRGKIIIPIDRHYTSIAYSRTLKTFSFTKESETAYFKGECNASGVQTSIEKTKSKSKPQQQTAKPKQETKPQQPKQETKTTPTPQPQPQPVRQPQPFQVWQACFMCGGSGQCRYCYGYGWAANGKDTCGICHGTGKCSQCAGHGGQNVIEYR